MRPQPEFWLGKRVCVTGGGFLGYHLVRRLLALGAGVRLLALPPRADHPLRREAGVDAVYGDILDPITVNRAVADAEVVIHTAGLVAVWGPALKRMHAVHVEGTRNVLTAAAPGARVVHVSSIVAVGASRRGDVLTEDHPFNLDGLAVDYVRAKRDAEEVALAGAAGRAAVVVNPGYLVGPEDYDRSVMGRFCVRFWKGRMLLAPPGGFNFVDVRDAAAGCLLAAERGAAGRRYILGGENHTLADFLTLLGKTAGLRPRVLPRLPVWALRALAGLAEARAASAGAEPYPSVQHARLNAYTWFCGSDRARAELGFQSRPLTDTLADAYRWWRGAGLAPPRGFNAWWMRPTAGAQAA